MFNTTQILIALLFLFFCAGAALSIIYWSLRNGISPMPSSMKASKKILDAIPRELNGPIYELGSGWGTLALAVAKKFPENLVVGYETSPVPYWISRFFRFQTGVSNVQFKKEDFMDISLSEAALIICYLYPGAMRKLQEKLSKELQPGTWIISNTFAIPEWKPYAILDTQDLYRSLIYIYRVGY
jgi:hypothetical protein